MDEGGCAGVIELSGIRQRHITSADGRSSGNVGPRVCRRRVAVRRTEQRVTRFVIRSIRPRDRHRSRTIYSENNSPITSGLCDDLFLHSRQSYRADGHIRPTLTLILTLTLTLAHLFSK